MEGDRYEGDRFGRQCCPGCGLSFFPQSIRARAIELLRIEGPLLSRELAVLLEIRSRRGLYDSLAVATMRGELAYAFVESNTKHVFGDGLVKVFGLPEDIQLLLANDQSGAQLPAKYAHWRHAHAMRHPGNRPRLFLKTRTAEPLARKAV